MAQPPLNERQATHEHVLDLCYLAEHPTPGERSLHGRIFAFEADVAKLDGRHGRADAFLEETFALEYKGPGKDLDKAYQQLCQYRESLRNPPLLIVSDIERIRVHTNFTNTVKRIHEIRLEAIAEPAGLEQIRAIFHTPDYFRADKTTAQVTQEIAGEFARLTEGLRRRGEQPFPIAHFLIRLLFCLFAEDIDLLPRNLFADLLQRTRGKPAALTQQLCQLFATMRQAMHDLDARSVDLPIIDRRLPDQSGLVPAPYARATGHTMPILHLTECAEVEDDVWESGITATLAKPIRLRPLRTLVRSLLLPKR